MAGRGREVRKYGGDEIRDEHSAGRPPSRNAMSEGSVSWSFGLGTASCDPTPTLVFLVKTAESLENKRVEFLVSAKKNAKECARI